MRQHRITSPVIGIDADPTGAEHLTIADFEKTSLQFVSHMPSPFDLVGSMIVQVQIRAK
jgi:hypothetical protein